MYLYTSTSKKMQVFKKTEFLTILWKRVFMDQRPTEVRISDVKGSITPAWCFGSTKTSYCMLGTNILAHSFSVCQALMRHRERLAKKIAQQVHCWQPHSLFPTLRPLINRNRETPAVYNHCTSHTHTHTHT